MSVEGWRETRGEVAGSGWRRSAEGGGYMEVGLRPGKLGSETEE